MFSNVFCLLVSRNLASGTVVDVLGFSTVNYISKAFFGDISSQVVITVPERAQMST